MYKIAYREIITGTIEKVDISQSRERCASRLSEAYFNQTLKRRTQKAVARSKEFFEGSAGLYHKVRDLVESRKLTDFNQVLITFREIYPQLHKDWQSALECGLICKAKQRAHTEAPYDYEHPTAVALRKAGINFMQPIVDEIMQRTKAPQPAQILTQAVLF